ncbi:TPA: hypothetical protein ACH3X1_005124 [Trebouxia sp. C0004]
MEELRVVQAKMVEPGSTEVGDAAGESAAGGTAASIDGRARNHAGGDGAGDVAGGCETGRSPCEAGVGGREARR